MTISSSLRSALLAVALGSVFAAPSFAADLVLHDEGNSGPFVAQAQAQNPAPAVASGPELVLHDEGNSGPSVVAPVAASAAHAAQHPGAHLSVIGRDDGMSAPQTVIR